MTAKRAGRTAAIAVVVATHDRPLRLRWLLNALEDQTLAHERFEVIVVHDSSGPQTTQLLRSHPLAAAGVLRAIKTAPRPGPADKRNAGWRAARAPVVAFTDDDCRPPPEWLERAVAAAEAHPGAVVQGATRADPHEECLRSLPSSRTLTVDPPSPWAETCNIVYPRSALERTGGFDEVYLAPVGEDTDLAMRAREEGFAYVGAPEMLTYHAVHTLPLWARVKEARRWRWQARLFKRHPSLRRHLVLGIFWKESHALLLMAWIGACLARSNAVFGLLALPWVLFWTPQDVGPSRQLRSIVRLPDHLAVDTAELVAVARGAIRHRTLLL